MAASAAPGLVSFNSYNIQNIAQRDGARHGRRTSTASGTSTTSTASAAAPAWRKTGAALCRLLWKLWSPTWAFDDATFERSAAAFDNPDFVDVVIHSYRHRFGLVPGDPAYADIERRLAAQPAIAVPDHHLRRRRRRRARTAPAHRRHAHHFTGPRSHRVVPGVGHNMPQEAPRVFADAVLELAPRVAHSHDRLAFKTLSEHRCFGGVQRFYEHDSREIGLPMRFSVFLPPQAANGPGAGAVLPRRPDLHRRDLHGQGRRPAHGRRAGPGAGRARHQPARRQRAGRRRDSWDFGVGAGFYLDATQAPWAAH